MIKKIPLLIILMMLGFTSCKSKKASTVVTKKERVATNKKVEKVDAKAQKIVDHALVYKGTKYKYGGTTERGMDCSGLVMTSFAKENIQVPRTTKDLATYGDWIDLKKVKQGDLLFFATKKNSRKVNHVGIVTSTRKNEVQFIHASSSKGVITSSLDERYWYYAFVQARRVL